MKRPKTAPALLVLAAVLAAAARAVSPPAEAMDAAGIALALKKLNVVGSALYVAAHPDDENTAFLAWLAGGRLVETGYLSMTRGDGGQNLIGTETGELIGVLRTQELLAARRIDGAQQFFTRAIDFGYSKSADETLGFWGKDAVLSDTVRVIRAFRPDVIVTRFPVTGEGGHGHHTASAILAEEAFQAAGDPARFPEQGLPPWRPTRLLWNVFRFGAEAPRSEVPGGISTDLGGYNPLLGLSYTEIAGRSRSMHKSQGFGAAERRGTWLNDFAPRLGTPAKSDLFDGVDLTWKRVPGGEAVAPILAEAERTFDPKDPAASLPTLLKAHAAMRALPDGFWKDVKLKELEEVIRSCAGLWLEAIASIPATTPGGEVTIAAMAVNRSSFPMRLTGLEVRGAHSGDVQAAGDDLKPNEPVRRELKAVLPRNAPYSNPYWLAEHPGKGLFNVTDPRLIGLPENSPVLVARFTITFQKSGEPVPFEASVLYRRTDPVKGEEYRPVEVAPPVTIRFDEKVYAFPRGKPRSVRVTLREWKAGAAGTLRLKLDGGTARPAEVPFAFKEKDEERVIDFGVTPPPRPGAFTIVAVAEVSGVEVSRSVVLVDYQHIVPQTLFPPAEATGLSLDIRTSPRRIGYVMGSGDEIPNALRQMGYEVLLLSDDDLSNGDFSRYDTIVTGIRAYNTRPRLKQVAQRLFDWVSAGGTLVEQYNTSQGLVTDRLGPYPFRVSRDRVTVEEAKVTFVAPDHPLLNVPNRITQADFDGWVQERGLYFPDQWAPEYQTVISTHDPGEPERPGGLLFARHGKGTFVYTGYAFFRQLPAGVPGAYRVFANLVEGGRAPVEGTGKR